MRWVATFLVMFCPTLASAENWPGWRGPRGDGTSLEAQVPVSWDGSKHENFAWKTPLAYGGHSSAIVWGDDVFVTGADEDRLRRMLQAFDRRTGRLRWEIKVEQSPLERKHKLNWASGTPLSDGERVYVTFLEEKELLVAAYNFSGREVWKVRPGVFSSVRGFCSRPVLFEDTVIINGDHDGESYLVVLSRRTGATVWKTPRKYKTRSFCTPIIREIDGRTQMILSGSKCVASYDPRTGNNSGCSRTHRAVRRLARDERRPDLYRRGLFRQAHPRHRPARIGTDYRRQPREMAPSQ